MVRKEWTVGSSDGYIVELNYAPVPLKGGKGFKFLDDAVRVETEKVLLAGLEKTWKAKLRCVALENPTPSRKTGISDHEVSTQTVVCIPKDRISEPPGIGSVPPESKGGHDKGAAESRLAELKSRLVQAKCRSSTHKPDEESVIVAAPPITLPKVRIPQRKADDLFDDYIAPKRIPSPELMVPDEGDYWGKLQYEKRKEKVDLGAIDMVLGITSAL